MILLLSLASLALAAEFDTLYLADVSLAPQFSMLSRPSRRSFNDASTQISLQSTGLGVLTTLVNVHTVYFGQWTNHDIYYLNNLVTFLSSDPWFNTISQGYYNHEGVYATDSISLDSWTVIDPKAYVNPGFVLDRDNVVTLVQTIVSSEGISTEGNPVVLFITGDDVVYADDGSCGWHGSSSQTDTRFNFIVAHQTNVNCTPSGPFPYEYYSLRTQALASTVAQQLAETITNSGNDNRWINTENGLGIAELCLMSLPYYTKSNTMTTVVLGATSIEYYVSQLYDLRQGFCVNSSPMNRLSRVTCTSSLNTFCTVDSNCTYNSTCARSNCLCDINYCAINSECVQFPAPATNCSAIPIESTIVVPDTSVRNSAYVTCPNNTLPSSRVIYCMSNGVWDRTPVCDPVPTTPAPITTTTTTTTTTTISPCVQYNDCFSCSAQVECGWCASSFDGMPGSCQPGLSTGSSNISAVSQCRTGQVGYWNYFSETCATTSTTTTTTTTPKPSACLQYSNCGSCIASTSCGWCSSQSGSSEGNCYPGHSTGASNSSGASNECINNTPRYWYRTVCPTPCVGAFTPCTLFCGNGTRTFVYTTNPSKGGTPCAYAKNHVESCNAKQCISCNSSQYQSQAPTATTDRVCSPISSCNYVSQYQSAAPTTTSNRVCTPLTICTSLQYESVAPTHTSNRVCTPLTYCNASQYEATPPTITSDRVCKTNFGCSSPPHLWVLHGDMINCTSTSCLLRCDEGYSKTGDFSCVAGVWNRQHCARCPYVKVTGVDAPFQQYNRIFKFGGFANGYSFYETNETIPHYLYRIESKWFLGPNLTVAGDLFTPSFIDEPFLDSSAQWRTADLVVHFEVVVACAASVMQLGGAFGTAVTINTAYAAFAEGANGTLLYENTDGNSPFYYFNKNGSFVLSDSINGSIIVASFSNASFLNTNQVTITPSPLTAAVFFSDVCTTSPIVPPNGNVTANCVGMPTGSSCPLTCDEGYYPTSAFTCIAGNWDMPSCLLGCGHKPSRFTSDSCAATSNELSCSTVTLCPSGQYTSDDYTCYNSTWNQLSCSTCPYMRVQGSQVAGGYYVYSGRNSHALPVYTAIGHEETSTQIIFGVSTPTKTWFIGDDEFWTYGYANFTTEQYPYQSHSWHALSDSGWVDDGAQLSCGCPVMKVYGGTGPSSFVNAIFAHRTSTSGQSYYENVRGTDATPGYLYRVEFGADSYWAIADQLNDSFPYVVSNMFRNSISDTASLLQLRWGVPTSEGFISWHYPTISSRSLCEATACSTPPVTPTSGSIANNCANTASGGECALTCNSGTVPSGNFVCQAGLWSKELCQPGCAVTPSIANGNISTNCNNTMSGGSCAFTCNRGYVPSSPSFTCLNNQWNSQACIPFCSQVSVSSAVSSFNFSGIYDFYLFDSYYQPIYQSQSGTAYLYRNYKIANSVIPTLIPTDAWVLSTVLQSQSMANIIAYSILLHEHSPATITGPFDIYSGEWFVVSTQNYDLSLQSICSSDICSGIENVWTNTTFSSGTGSYSNNANCSFLLSSTIGYMLNISFSRFELQNNHDFLFVYDGVTADESSLLFSLTGSNIPDNIIAASTPYTNVSRLLVLSADSTISRRGFVASVVYLPNPALEASTGASTSTTIYIYGGIGAGALILLILLILAFFLVARSKKKAKQHQQQQQDTLSKNHGRMVLAGDHNDAGVY